MKARLMYKDRDFDPEAAAPFGADDLRQDLALETLWDAMAQGDEFLLDVARTAVLSSETEPKALLYRQAILRDCMDRPAVVRELYDLCIETLENKRRNYWSLFGNHPGPTLSSAVSTLEMLLSAFERLKAIADQHGDKFRSEGFTRLFTEVREELNEDYKREVREHLKALTFRNGVPISARLDPGNTGRNYVLRKPRNRKRSWSEWMFGPREKAYSYRLHPRDQQGAQALSELRDRGINEVANAAAQSTDHILDFFRMLRTELAFYVGCLNLCQRLQDIGMPSCFPAPASAETRAHSYSGLYDVCLALTLERPVTANDGDAARKNAVIVTGANQGGKSTYLRSIGLAQLMMQCGMFVPASSFAANVCAGLFTHFKREEDTTMESGKFDEELRRMSQIVDHLRPDSMILFNESFAATNEHEGSEIARQITETIVECGIKVFFVTHLATFARGLYRNRGASTLFLRAERKADGTRSFKIIKGEPEQSSYGRDLYAKLFQKNESGTAAN